MARRYPTADAIVFEGEGFTWGEIQMLARKLATGLRNRGVEKGDSVVLLLPNVPHFVVAYYAILKLGAVVVAANPTFTSRELESYISKAEANIIITLDVLYEKIAETWKRAGVSQVLVGNALDLMPVSVRLSAGIFDQVERWCQTLRDLSPRMGELGLKGFDALEKRSAGLRRIRAAPKPRTNIPYSDKVQRFRDAIISFKSGDLGVEVASTDVAALVYTTGTTGEPKAATLSHGNLIANAYQMRCWFPELEEGRETILAVLPFFHAYGLTLVMNAGLVLAARSVLIPRPVLSDILEAIERYRPTALPGVPSLFVSIINNERAKRYDLRSIRVCVSGGAPLPVEVKERFEAITGGHLFEGYGLTEAGPLTHAQPFDQSAPAGSIGLPVSDTDAIIVDDYDKPVAIGETGELLVRGPQVMEGYWRNQEETSRVKVDGWLRTGDIARMDHRGFFFIVDRKKDLIITGGENIAPRDIEEALYRHPKVAEAAVAGVPHGYGGEMVKAFVVLKPEQSATEGELKRFLGRELAHYKVPRHIEFRTDLPKSPAGKVLRRVLVEEEQAKRQAGPDRTVEGDEEAASEAD